MEATTKQRISIGWWIFIGLTAIAFAVRIVFHFNPSDPNEELNTELETVVEDFKPEEVQRQEPVRTKKPARTETYERDTRALALKNRVYFYETSSTDSKTSSFIVQGQSANALQRQGNFVKVVFEYNGRQTRGYFLMSEIEIVSESDLYGY